jgi:glycosyltransferase involved in cell wall biosynthesis
MAPRVSLVVAVYDQPRFLELVLTSLAGQTLEDFEVVIADDGSGPAIREVIEAHRARLAQPIHHVWHPDEGFRKTVIVNRAVARSEGEILVFIDGDCILHRRFLERHHRRSRPGQLLSGRRVMLDAEITRTLTAEDVASRRLESPAFWWAKSLPGSRRRGLYMPWMFALNRAIRAGYSILGSNFSLPREDFLAVNGYDERILGRGLEDSNLDARLQKAGIRAAAISSEAIQYHLFHRSDPMPHDAATWRTFSHPDAAWTPFGLIRGPVR